MIKINKKDFAACEYPNETSLDREPITRTTSPITVGSSVIGLHFDKGVILCSDTLISYGRLAQMKNVQRASKITDYAAFASSGEYSDFQEAQNMFEQMQQNVKNADDNISYTPADFANFLARNCYAKRNKMNPLYMTSVIGGFHQGKKYLASVDLFGTLIESDHIVTGFANYLCKPIISNYYRNTMSEKEVKGILEECFKVCYYRDCGAFDKIQFTIIDESGVRIEEPFRLETKWDYKLTRERANEKIYNQ